jgi:hypothetical protein
VAKPGERVSGTQIWTGRNPAARIFSRRRLTRWALVNLSMPLHVARGFPANKPFTASRETEVQIRRGPNAAFEGLGSIRSCAWQSPRTSWH